MAPEYCSPQGRFTHGLTTRISGAPRLKWLEEILSERGSAAMMDYISIVTVATIKGTGVCLCDETMYAQNSEVSFGWYSCCGSTLLRTPESQRERKCRWINTINTRTRKTVFLWTELNTLYLLRCMSPHKDSSCTDSPQEHHGHLAWDSQRKG